MPPPSGEPPALDEQTRFEIIMKHGHQDLVQAVAFNGYGDRCATGSVDGKIRVFNRHRDGVWRFCDGWTAHGGEILDIQWLPPTIYPNLIASLGIEGRFKMWTEDPEAAPGRRFSQRSKNSIKAAFETRSARSMYRSFSLKHDDVTRRTFLALLAADGMLSVQENEMPENLTEFSDVAELRVCPKPPRGEEVSFRVRFDPNPDPCYTALRAGVHEDALSLVVAAMDKVKIYRSKPITTTSYGLQSTGRTFYQAAEITGHGGLVRDVTWAPGNFRGFDILATACQDGFVRVVRLDTPISVADDGKSWATADVLGKGRNVDGGNANSGSGGGHRNRRDGRQSASGLLSGAALGATHSTSSLVGGGGSGGGGSNINAQATSLPVSVASSISSTARDTGPLDATAATVTAGTGGADDGSSSMDALAQHGHGASATMSTATSFSGLPPLPDASGGRDSEAQWTGGSGEVRHTVREVSKLENARTPVWRVAFDDDGQILGTAGDDGKLVCYRQTPDGTWARSSELSVQRTRRTVPAEAREMAR